MMKRGGGFLLTGIPGTSRFLPLDDAAALIFARDSSIMLK